MDAISGLGLVLQLAHQGASLLEEATACKRKAKDLKGLLDALTARLEMLEESNVDVTLLEASLHDILEALKPFCGAKRGLATQARILIRARAARQALADAEQRLQTCLQICQIDLVLNNHTRQQEQTDDENALDDEEAQSDLRAALVSLHEQDALGEEADEILEMLQGNPALDLAAILDGQLGTRRQRKAVESLTKGLKQAEESELATLDSRDVSISAPLEVLGEGQSRRGSQASLKLVQALVRDLAGDGGNLVRTLSTLRDLLEQECKTGTSEALRSDTRSRGILVTCKRILDHETDPGVVAGTLWVLGFALSGKTGADFRQAAVDDHGMATIAVEMMQIHAHDPEVPAAACRVVWSLAHGSGRNKVILGQDLNVGKEILAAMRAHPGSEGVQQYACGALWNLAFNERNRVILGQTLNVGKEIVTAMRAHPGSEGVQKQGCVAVLSLAFNERNKVILGQDLNVGKEIMAAMRAHPGSEGVQKQGCAALRSLAANERNKVILCQDLNVGREIVAAMRAHPGSEGVQEYACGASCNLAANDRNRVIFGQTLNVGKEVLAAMRALPGREGVQKQACGALCNLAVNERNKVILGQDLNSGKEIVAAMRAHPGSEGVQEYACTALWSLAVNERNKVILGQDLNVGKEILAAMRAHPGSEGVQEYACAALMNLAANERNKVILGQDLNVGKEIVAAMRAHPGSEGVQNKACTALWSLSVNDRNSVILGQILNVGKEIVAAMRAYPGSEGVQEYACAALWSLASDLGVRTKLRALGALEAVNNARARFPSLQSAKDARSKLE